MVLFISISNKMSHALYTELIEGTSVVQECTTTRLTLKRKLVWKIITKYRISLVNTLLKHTFRQKHEVWHSFVLSNEKAILNSLPLSAFIPF